MKNKTWNYVILNHTKGQVEAETLPKAILKMIEKYYEKIINPEVMDFQYMHFTIEEKK